MTCAFFAPVPWAGKPMMAFLVAFAQMPQFEHWTSSRCVAGQMATKFPAGVRKGFVVPLGTIVTTGPTPAATNSSARCKESADKLTTNPSAFALAIAAALAGMAGS